MFAQTAARATMHVQPELSLKKTVNDGSKRITVSIAARAKANAQPEPFTPVRCGLKHPK